MHDGRVPVGSVDITTAAFTCDPVAGYNRLRAVSPVSWQFGARGFLLTRYDDVARAVRDPRLHEPDLANAWRKIAAKLSKDFGPSLRVFAYMPFIHEGERHRQLRATLARAVAPFASSDEVFARCVTRRLSVARRDGGLDLVRHFAGALLFDIFCELMELSESERDEIRAVAHLSWALDSTLSVKDRENMTAILAACMASLRSHVDSVLRQPGMTLLHGIHRALPEGEEDKVGATAALAAVMLMMGNDALGGCISMAVENLLSGHTDEPLPQHRWADLSDDAIRYAATVDFLNRIATANVEIGGCPFRPGERLILSPLAANHDASVVGAHAGRVTPRPHIGPGLAFGGGAHVCVGARMARNIARAAFLGLAELPPLSLAGPGTPGRGKVIRTLSSLPLQVN